MLVQEADLIGNLRIIKDFFLLGRGELFLAFIDQAHHILRVPAAANTEHGMYFYSSGKSIIVEPNSNVYLTEIRKHGHKWKLNI